VEKDLITSTDIYAPKDGITLLPFKERVTK